MEGYLARVLAPSVSEDDFWRLAERYGWRWQRRAPEQDEAEEFSERLSFSLSGPKGERIDYYSALPGIPAVVMAPAEHIALLGVVERHLAVWLPDEILAQWERATTTEQREWLWGAAIIYYAAPTARDMVYRVIRDCLYAEDARLRRLGAIGVERTGWPEWALIAADARRSGR